jgi:hypothetical protein
MELSLLDRFVAAAVLRGACRDARISVRCSATNKIASLSSMRPANAPGKLQTSEAYANVRHFIFVCNCGVTTDQITAVPVHDSKD